MPGMRRKTRILLKQVAIICVGLFVTGLVRDRFGWIGVLTLIPVAFAAGYFGTMFVRKWTERNAIK